LQIKLNFLNCPVNVESTYPKATDNFIPLISHPSFPRHVVVVKTYSSSIIEPEHNHFLEL
jgi:hypothetical protein